MRALSICLLFAGLSQSAKIYLHPSQSLPSSLSPRRASIALSHHLGLEFFEPLGDDGEVFEGLLDEKPFVGKGVSNGLLLTVNEASVKDVLPSSLKPSFSLSKTPSTHSIISSYLQRARHAYSTIYSIYSAQTPNAPHLLDLFSVSSEETETFLSEIFALSHFLESGDSAKRFGAFEFTGLERIRTAYGHNSEQYQLAARATHAALESALSQRNLHIALLSVPAAPATFAKRQQPPQQSPLPPQSPVPQQPIGAVSSCFATADSCSNATDECSNRGECVQASKAGRTCFVCACEQTRNDRGKIETWVGESCERKDISGPFVLITGTVIALILTIAGSVSLLISIGGHELPSTLTGGVVGSKKD